ncbi:MAG: hypothetical protein CAF45_005430 [Nitrospira sp. CG24E]|nr:MAG: hypothetical protein CAF45_005430 [Nitrospira sp. CG24E]
MRKVLALGAAIIFVGSVGVSMAQERLQTNQSGLGVGEGVGDVSGSSTRVTTFDRTNFLDRLSQPETVYGRLFAIDLAQNRLMIETGGAGKVFDEGQEGKSGYGARTIMTLHLTDRSNMQAIKNLNIGDDITIQVMEETTAHQPYGTGRKFVIETYVTHVDATKQGFGGLGQRPDPESERAIATNRGGITGGIAGSVLPGKIDSGITSPIGEYTGAAPCWQCEPQPGWGNAVGNKSDYGADYNKPNLVKGQN